MKLDLLRFCEQKTESERDERALLFKANDEEKKVTALIKQLEESIGSLRNVSDLMTGFVALQAQATALSSKANSIDTLLRSVTEHPTTADLDLEGKLKGLSIDEQYTQSSLEFESPVKIVFCGAESCKPVASYYDLPEIPMTPEEKEILAGVAKGLKKDDPQLFIKGIYYDTDEKKVYIDAVRANYSFLRAINTNKFPAGSEIYKLKLFKTGVISPYITQDDYVALVERNDAFKLVSAASGFFDPHGEDKQLNPQHRDLVVRTAEKESIEEFLGVGGSLDATRVGYDQAQVTSVSYRAATKGMPTIEFIAPIRLHCHKDMLETIIKNNEAKDSKEHTGKFQMVPMRADERDKGCDTIAAAKMPGYFLWSPILLAASRIVNDFTHNSVPTRLPNCRSQAIPVSAVQRQSQLTWGWGTYSSRLDRLALKETVQSKEKNKVSQQEQRKNICSV